MEHFSSQERSVSHSRPPYESAALSCFPLCIDQSATDMNSRPTYISPLKRSFVKSAVSFETRRVSKSLFINIHIIQSEKIKTETNNINQYVCRIFHSKLFLGQLKRWFCD